MHSTVDVAGQTRDLHRYNGDRDDGDLPPVWSLFGRAEPIRCR